MLFLRRPGLTAGVASVLTGGIAALAAPAMAQINQTSLFRNQFYQQTGVSTTALVGSDFDARLFTQNPTDVSTATLDYPGPGTPATLTFQANDPVLGTIYEFNSGEQPTLADVEAAYPVGAGDTYTINYSGGTLAAGSVATVQTQEAFPVNAPSFDAASYNALQGLNSGQAATLGFNSFVTNPAASQGLIFFTVFDAATNAVVYSQDFLDTSTSSVLLPANTLTPGKSYAAELDFSERINGVDPTSGVTNDQGFDQRTQAAFTTAPAALPVVPEPTPLALLGLGLLPLGLRAAQRRRTA